MNWIHQHKEHCQTEGIGYGKEDFPRHNYVHLHWLLTFSRKRRILALWRLRNGLRWIKVFQALKMEKLMNLKHSPKMRFLIKWTGCTQGRYHKTYPQRPLNELWHTYRYCFAISMKIFSYFFPICFIFMILSKSLFWGAIAFKIYWKVDKSAITLNKSNDVLKSPLTALLIYILNSQGQNLRKSG